MFIRSLEPIVRRFAEIYPVVGITGPRQSGKTTLAKKLFSHVPCINLENLDIRVQALNDPREFLSRYTDGAIFDEIQHAPELLSYMQQMVDESPQKGRFIITGSQNFALSHHVAQSLSGRIGMTTLLPLSLYELGMPEYMQQAIFQGGYPGLYQNKMVPVEFYPSYIQTYLERDVRQLKNIENLGRFQNFVKLCAARIGHVVNYSSLAQDADVSHTTVRQWLTILEASYLIFLLQPFHNNFNKRLIKNPKLYFYDTGLACSLLGLEKESQIDTHYLKGNLYENSIILEILKGRLNQGLAGNIYFWRDVTGHEVDLIAEWAGTIKAIEIKATATFSPQLVKNITYFSTLGKNIQGYLVYTGTQDGTYQNNTLVPVRKIHTII